MVSEESVHPSPQSHAAFGPCGVAVEDQPGRPQGGRAVFGSPVLAFKFLAFGTVVLSLLFQPQAAAQSKGGLKGTVSLKETGDPLHQAMVLIVELGRSTFSGDDGSFEFDRVPAGTDQVISHPDSLFTEDDRTVTPGYGVVNLKASYTYAQQHLSHLFAVNVFNLGDRLYRNHSSFIKDLAPEIGRGIRFTYMVRFF